MSAISPHREGPDRPVRDTLMDVLDRVEYRRVSADDQLDPVYRLRYEAYRREQSVPINAQEVVRDEFDDLPNAHCFGVYIDGLLVSSVRLHHLTAEFRTSPSHSVFQDVLDPLLDQGMTMIDPGRFTADYEASLAYPALPFLTLRIAVMATWYYRVKFCLSSVRPEHAAFYRRVFKSTQIGAARYYHGLTFPMVLYACDVPVVYPPLMHRYPFFMSTEAERNRMFSPQEQTVRTIHPTARIALDLAEHETAVV